MVKYFVSTTVFLFSFLIINAQKKELTNELIFASSTFKTEKVDGFTSLKNGEDYSLLETTENGSEINVYAFKTGEILHSLCSSLEVFGDNNKKMDAYTFSEEEGLLIIKTDLERVYRHSDIAHYFIYDLEKKSTTMMSDTSLGKVSLGYLSPGGKYFAFVRDNNLFYIDLDTRKETQVTKDGKKNEIINGAVDWLYEEEFQNHVGYYWSPDGNKIAYYRFDESAVKTFTLTTYGDVYPEWDTYKYPKAGEVNSNVSIHVLDIESGNSHTLNTQYEEYIPRIKWTTNNNELVMMRLNRHQNHLEVILFDVSQKQDTGSLIYSEISDTYIKVNDNLIFLDDGKNFIWNSNKDGFNHIYLYSLKGELIKQLTSGEQEVDKFLGVDQKRKRVYFTAYGKEIQNTALYYVNLKGDKRVKLSQQDGDNSTEFSADFGYYVNTYSNASTPPISKLYDYKGKEIRVLVDNSNVKESLKEYTLPQKEFLYFETERGDSLLSYIIKPSDFDSTKTYPVLLDIYGGPQSFKAKNKWDGTGYLWQSMMVEKGMIIICVEPRGTGRRGKEWQDLTYLKLGELETEDFISASKYMQTFSYVNDEKIFIKGGSYGGFMALNCITKGADYFDAAVSLSPVTDWRYYDDVYVERYMRTPEENKEGYANYAPLKNVELLDGPLLLIHGDKDDNVHIQNTMDFIVEAVNRGKHFELFIYPNDNHYINSGVNRIHVYENVSEFLLEQMQEK